MKQLLTLGLGYLLFNDEGQKLGKKMINNMVKIANTTGDLVIEQMKEQFNERKENEKCTTLEKE